MEPSGPSTFFLGRLLTVDLISLTDKGVFRPCEFVSFQKSVHFISVVKSGADLFVYYPLNVCGIGRDELSFISHIAICVFSFSFGLSIF